MADSTIRKQIISSPLDKFGRVRTSDPSNRLDVEFLYDKQPELYDEVTSGGATVIHNANPKDLTMAIVNATNGTSAAMYSHYDIPYTPGNSQLIDITGVLDLANIGSGTPQLFLRTNITGTTSETVVDMSSWDAPQNDADWADSHIFAFDFQSLKVGTVEYFMVRDGTFVKVHTIHNDNIRNTGYWQQATLPLYWRIYNDATYTYMELGYGDTNNAIGFRYRITANASATMKAICGTVKSEGGISIQDLPGYQRSIDNGTTAVTVSTTLIPVLSIRVKSTLNSITNRGLYIPTGYTVSGNNPIRYVLLYRPTLTGATWTDVDTTYSGMEYDVSASAVSGGIQIDSDYLSTGRNTESKDGGVLGRTILSQGRSGTSDILTIAAIRTTTSNCDTYCTLKWKELR